MKPLTQRSFSALVLFITLLAISPIAKAQAPGSRFAKVSTIRVHYETYGQGKDALVFIHGWACNLTHWQESAPVFARQMRVIAIDLPGHGLSDKPEKTAYSMDLFAEAINAVLIDAGVERATLVGHSMGTPVIRQFYRKYPARTRALVIVDGALKPFGTRESMEPLLSKMRAPDYKEFAGTFVDQMSKTMKDPKKVEQIRVGMLATPQYVMVSAMEEMLNPEIWKQEDKITVPALVLMAPNAAWTPEYEKYVHDLIPVLDYQKWAGVSHFLMMDDPQKFNEVVSAFLKKNKLM